MDRSWVGLGPCEERRRMEVIHRSWVPGFLGSWVPGFLGSWVLNVVVNFCHGSWGKRDQSRALRASESQDPAILLRETGFDVETGFVGEFRTSLKNKVNWGSPDVRRSFVCSFLPRFTPAWAVP